MIPLGADIYKTYTTIGILMWLNHFTWVVRNLYLLQNDITVVKSKSWTPHLSPRVHWQMSFTYSILTITTHQRVPPSNRSPPSTLCTNLAWGCVLAVRSIFCKNRLDVYYTLLNKFWRVWFHFVKFELLIPLVDWRPNMTYQPVWDRFRCNNCPIYHKLSSGQNLLSPVTFFKLIHFWLIKGVDLFGSAVYE